MRIEKVGAQGDVLFMRLTAVPEGAALESEGRAIVAHSETGHHHVVEAQGLEFFKDPKDPMTCYLRLAEDADVVHLRPYDTHAPVTLPAGSWAVRRQREYTPDSWRMVQD